MRVTDLEPPSFTEEDLVQVETLVRRAQSERAVDHMTVLGFGEFSVAVGWPSEDPAVVFKRGVPYGDRSALQADIDYLRSFIAHVEQRGGQVVPTDFALHTRSDDGTVLPYLIQPAVPREMLAETTLEEDQAVAHHPMLVALYEFVRDVSNDDFTIDPQVANFAWDGERLSIFDVSGPMRWDGDGNLDVPLEPVFYVVPRFLRSAAANGLEEISARYRGIHGSLTQVCVFLLRTGHDDWADAARETFNARLEVPIDADEVWQRFEEDRKAWASSKRAVRLKRWWVTQVKRQPFEYIVTDSFAGRVL